MPPLRRGIGWRRNRGTTEEGHSNLFCQFAKQDIEVCCINVLIRHRSVLLESAIIITINDHPCSRDPYS